MMTAVTSKYNIAIQQNVVMMWLHCATYETVPERLNRFLQADPELINLHCPSAKDKGLYHVVMSVLIGI